ncbi:PQQ-dependent sugar dehydrogenase [Pontiella agarivorans]|uniref:PQQ-dependent sugar dehydrogenase n=1 Tax=Pontiella agarivorans TaxID=3038953 RepID=A0ABU5MVQ6_9BACT|nr:PQQ-dependent sugar dehydrogenase [Pontiella agarivorans]MDZ8118299.1 PQQ-dependent sugar dehydrogenase [Pontiella agarivorans]
MHISNRLIRLFILLIICTGSAFSQLVREANTTLNLPAAAPEYNSFAFTDAFPTLSPFEKPVAIVSPPGESNMLFIVEQPGKIMRITDLDGTPQKSTFADFSSRIGLSYDQGLLGLAFHPNFQSNRYFYVFYTTSFPRRDRLSRFTAPVDWDSSGTVDLSTEYILIDQPDDSPNHNGGDLHFGPEDGYLYIPLGDEGEIEDRYENSQNIELNFFSGIIRIDVDKKPGSLEPNPHDDQGTDAVIRDNGIARYGIPPDNPFVGATHYNGIPLTGNIRTEFWATGLRSPWRMGFDPLTGRLFVGDVGENAREEIHLVNKGDNCGWDYLEGTIERIGAPTPPPGFNPADPIFEYPHESGSYSVIGGRVYRGESLPQLFGKYIFSESYDGRVWALTETEEGSGVFTDEVIATESFLVAFGEHPATKEILAADYIDGKIKQLTASGPATGSLPATLTDTGAFSDLASLTPNSGIVAYETNADLWSDDAEKQRWFSIPDPNDHAGWARDKNWELPTGAVWIKHFDLRTDLGEPGVWKRLETRFIVKTEDGIYGITYQWNDTDTEAYLVPAEGTNVTYTVTQPDNSTYQQTWGYPSRSECMQCHTKAGGYALSFNTRQLNRDYTFGNVITNQVSQLAQSGFFSNTVDDVTSLPRIFPIDDESQSLHARVRSYFDVNCSHCHRPESATPSAWNGLMADPFVNAEIYNGAIGFDNGNSNACFAVAGEPENSVILDRMAGTSPFQRMPPIGSNRRDLIAEQVISDWIEQELHLYPTYEEWRAQQTTDPGGPDEDPDGDGVTNDRERIARTDPYNAQDRLQYDFQIDGNMLNFSYNQLAGLDFNIETSTNLVEWTELNPAPPSFPAANSPAQEQGPVDDSPVRYFRLKVEEP